MTNTRIWPMLVLWVLVGLALPAAVQAGPVCSDCRRAINGRYINQNGTILCTSCFDRRLPACASCKKKVKAQHVVSEGKAYCDQACFRKSLPHCEICNVALDRARIINGKYYCQAHMNLPTCSSCGQPHQNGHVLGDGRQLCADCKPKAVFDAEVATMVYNRAIADVKLITGYRSPTTPPLELVDSVALQRLRNPNVEPRRDGQAMERGFYMRLEETTEITDRGVTTREVKISEKIVALNGLHPADLLVVTSHELTHDLLAELFPELENAPAWVEEGLCQYVAANVARRYKAPNALRAIEEMPDEVYGDGYRYFAAKLGPNNWPGAIAWLRSTKVEVLPSKPPK